MSLVRKQVEKDGYNPEYRIEGEIQKDYHPEDLKDLYAVAAGTQTWKHSKTGLQIEDLEEAIPVFMRGKQFAKTHSGNTVGSAYNFKLREWREFVFPDMPAAEMTAILYFGKDVRRLVELKAIFEKMDPTRRRQIRFPTSAYRLVQREGRFEVREQEDKPNRKPTLKEQLDAAHGKNEALTKENAKFKDIIEDGASLEFFLEVMSDEAIAKAFSDTVTIERCTRIFELAEKYYQETMVTPHTSYSNQAPRSEGEGKWQ